MSTTQENLKQVKEEANNILKTLSAVKGDRYAETVRVLLLCKQLADIGGIMCEEIGAHNEAMAKACAFGMSQCLTTLAITLRTVSQSTDDDWNSMMKDSTAIIDSIGGLMRQAVDAGRDGKSFGGTD